MSVLQSFEDKVVDSRESKEGDAIRRRRECLACERRFTTYERIDEVPYMVIKKDGRREKFDRQKVLAACSKPAKSVPSAWEASPNWSIAWKPKSPIRPTGRYLL